MAEQPPHIFIATPMYGGMSTAVYTSSLVRLTSLFIKLGWRFSFSFKINESLIDRARNSLAAGFLNSDATHLLFIDADIGFMPEDVAALVTADKEIICGLYPLKMINWDSVSSAVKHGVSNLELYKHTGSFVVNFLSGEEKEVLKLNRPFEIKDGGTGMMLIKREVFTKLKETVEHYRCHETDDQTGIRHGDMIPRFFASSIDPEDNCLLSEDYHFCRLWREAGGNVWAAPWMHLVHCGTYLFDGTPTHIRHAEISDDRGQR